MARSYNDFRGGPTLPVSKYMLPRSQSIEVERPFLVQVYPPRKGHGIACVMELAISRGCTVLETNHP